MTDLSGVSGPSQTRVETGQAEAANPVRAPGPPIDTGRVESAGALPRSMPPMPRSPGTIDYGLAGSATRTVADNVGVDFGRIAALMMQIDSELARAARDAQVQQIESVADQMHASAGDIRASARMALAGGVVSGGAQIGAAGMSIGGGIKGMSLTASIPAAEPQVSVPETAPGAAGEASSMTQLTEETKPVAAGSGEPSAPPLEDIGMPETGGQSTSATQAEQVRQQATEENVKDVSGSKQRAAATKLDHTLSQQLSARSHNIALFTQGLSQLTTATGEIIKSAMDYESRQKDADSKEAEARAEEQRAYLDRTKGFADSMQKGAHDMLGIFQQMEDSIHQTHKQIWSKA